MTGIVYGVVLLVIGALGWFVARGLSRGKIGPNLVLGYSTKATRSSREAWFAAHKAVWPDMGATALLVLGAGVISLLVGALQLWTGWSALSIPAFVPMCLAVVPWWSIRKKANAAAVAFQAGEPSGETRPTT